MNRRACHVLAKTFPRFFIQRSQYLPDLRATINARIAANAPATVVEVGGVDRPLLQKSPSYKYIGIDIDDQPTCYDVYDEFVVQSVEDALPLTTDLIISCTLLEHVPNNTASFKVMYEALNDGGVMMHYIPSKYHFYSICLRIVGPNAQKKLIKYLRPDAVDVTGYPAFFDKCSPAEMRKLCESTGFDRIEVTPYYKATNYFAFFVPAYLIVAIFENLFAMFNVQFFASGFNLSAYKKSGAV